MRVLGRAVIKYNGQALKTLEGAKLFVGGVERETVVGTEVHGYAEKAVAPYVECELSVTQNTDVSILDNMTDGTIVFEADTGQTWIISNAWTEKPAEITASGGGKVPRKFVGKTCKKM